jgi:hypothetical protein
MMGWHSKRPRRPLSKKKAAADADMLGRLDLTHQRHWLRTAAMVLMLISVFINLLV